MSPHQYDRQLSAKPSDLSSHDSIHPLIQINQHIHLSSPCTKTQFVKLYKNKNLKEKEVFKYHPPG